MIYGFPLPLGWMGSPAAIPVVREILPYDLLIGKAPTADAKLQRTFDRDAQLQRTFSRTVER